MPILRQWLPYYERRFEPLSCSVSGSWCGRSARRPWTACWPRPGRSILARGRCGTKPGSLLRTEIPIRTGTWDLSRPGYLEADSVAHCGASLAGDFIWSLTYTDIFSGWTEGGAVWNKGAAGVLAPPRGGKAACPLRLLGFDSDNGGEFLNHHLWAYMSASESSGGVHSFAPLSLRRQRPCGTKELDLGASTLGLWTIGRSATGGADLARSIKKSGDPCRTSFCLA